MKPLKLTMTAFGPYKYSETIDFTELDQNHLFVISGNTGAGKTTIFDGICFALYGSASGSDRENQTMLRSDFAEDNTHTSVELIFELHGRIYRILRQLGHVKKGNKTKTGDKYEFYEIMGDKEIPCVDRQIVSEIDRKVETLIGLTKDQFKQIVMLPQGEFRKLLTSETENKEEILRRIFKTESYQQLVGQLNEKKQTVKQSYNQAKQAIDHYIQGISSNLPNREDSLLFQVISEEHFNVNQVIAGLKEEMEFYIKQIKNDQKEYDDAYAMHNKKQSEYFQAKVINERFQELDEKKARLQQLEEKKPNVEIKQRELEVAERAAAIEIYEKQVNDWRLDEEHKSNLLKQAKLAKSKSTEQFEQARDVFREQEAKKDEREQVTKKLDHLKDILPMVQEMEKTKQHIDGLKKQVETASINLEKVNKDVVQKQKMSDDHYQKIKELDEKTTLLQDKQEKLSELKVKGQALLDYKKLQKRMNELEADVVNKKQAYDQLKQIYQEQEEIWLNNQAVVLAEHLHDGEACPVCGSKEHPQKAVNSGKVVTREELQSLRVNLDNSAELYRKADGVLAANKSNMKEMESELLEQFNIPKEEAIRIYDEVVIEGKRVKEEVDQLLKLAEELRSLRLNHEKELTVIRELQTKKEKLDHIHAQYKEEYRTALTRYEERLNHVPEDVRNLTVLESEIEKTANHKQKLEKSWELAQKQLEQAKEEDTKTDANLHHAIKQLEETKEKKQKAEIEFKTKLEEAAFASLEAYKNAKMSEVEQQKWKVAIQQFNEELSTVKSQVHELQLSLKDKRRQDLIQLESQLEQLKQQYENKLTRLNLSKEYYQEADKLIIHILDGHEQVVKFEKDLSMITDLHDMLRGQNDKRISFERYLQIEYLERIIEAANHRLKRLSNGQFYLIRSDRQESHGKQSGLGLDVFDTYTGQTRDVKTLSGGEKFNASLCLALGMSDVIQSFQGNISIETMFIDEGFGSLDEESLFKAIDTLIELQQTGRMIGVISHVQELKNMFPAVLQVAKTKEGYSKTKFVLK
ncbi:SMC family ATPase [Bacilli bacterium]|nr:exonuclease [Bacilli bacterium VT-13-104]PZD83725.1 SMC family ATPase [Bacilli bacterium]PZD84914.1 SMC family ATPase [Bacilli bacterium]PZD87241.1 SMC family ATPase [Bacilli bacterium]RCO05443.1 SMC family ATPase [Bacilli bacterium]